MDYVSVPPIIRPFNYKSIPPFDIIRPFTFNYFDIIYTHHIVDRVLNDGIDKDMEMLDINASKNGKGRAHGRSKGKERKKFF